MVNLVYSLFADTKKFTNGFSRAEKSVKGLENTTKKASSAIQTALVSLGGAVTLGGLTRLSDSITNVNTKLANVSKTTAEFDKAFNGLFNVAQETGQNFDAVIDNYVKLNVSLDESTKKTFDLTKVTELLARGFAAAGTDARTVAGTTLQLTQGLATNFQAAGQELNSLIEGAPVLAKAIAQQLGGNAAVDLKKFAEEGKLTQETFLRALIQAEETINAFKIPPTIMRSITRVRNEFFLLMNNSKTFKDVSQSIANGFDFIGENLESLIKALTGATVAFATFYAVMNAGAILSVGKAVAGTAIAFTQLAIGVRTASEAMALFNMTTAANPLTITAGIVAGISAIIFFRKEIVKATRDVEVFGIDVAGFLEQTFTHVEVVVKGVINIVAGAFYALYKTIKARIDDLKLALFDLSNSIAKTQFGKDLGIEPAYGLFIDDRAGFRRARGRSRSLLEGRISGFANDLKVFKKAFKEFEGLTLSEGATNVLTGKKYEESVKEVKTSIEDIQESIKNTVKTTENSVKDSLSEIDKALVNTKDVGIGVFDSFANASIKSFQDLKDFALRTLQEIAVASARIAIGGQKSTGGGLVDLAGNALGEAIGGMFTRQAPLTASSASLFNQGGLLPSFSTGGRINVGGGIDSQLVAFRAMPNENITVERPGQNLSNGGTYYIDARGADSAGLARLERTITQLNGSIETRAVSAVRDAKERGRLA